MITRNDTPKAHFDQGTADILHQPVEIIRGVGEHTKRLLQKLCGPDIGDLIFHAPSHGVDRSRVKNISDVVDGEIVTLKLRIVHHIHPARLSQPCIVTAEDHTGTIDLVFFRAKREMIARLYPLDQIRIVSGKIERRHGSCRMIHPDYAVVPDQLSNVACLEPIYPLTANLTNPWLRKIIGYGISMTPHLPEWLNPEMLQRHQWPSWKQSVIRLHAPRHLDDFLPHAPHRERLAYDALLANQLTLQIMRQKIKENQRSPSCANGALIKRLTQLLPFRMTQDQIRAIDDILGDLQSSQRMFRLIQGDVGCGKTLVACSAMLWMIEAGFQSAMMAPTDLLARQHFEGIQHYTNQLGVRIGLLTGKIKPKERKKIQESIESGEIQLIIGTHALFQESVRFHRLGLVVIDEQHRFGVDQRRALASKSVAGKGEAGKERADEGVNADILMMTATPIPRTMLMVNYGDADVSKIQEKPKNRQPIQTQIIPMKRIAELEQRLMEQIKHGHKIYWVCPLIEESEKMNLSNVVERFKHLESIFGPIIGLVHGQMKSQEKEKTMDEFTQPQGHIKILVATTVIEVGMDVPDATIMVIEHAERFGLAQLHQLRGRVGRGHQTSYCILLYGYPIGDASRRRLEIMRNTQDGFVIAEEDFKMRGSGDIAGTQQSGLPALRLVDWEHHQDLLKMAHQEARYILTQDPLLSSERGEKLKTLLKIHNQSIDFKHLA